MFISVGTVENLEAFLEKNPNVPRDLAFVETSGDFDAYKAVGFKTFLENEFQKPRKPEMTAGDMWTYVRAAGKTAPKVNTLEAVQRVGGTFVLNGSDVVYGWDDQVPGDFPEPEDVLSESGILQA